jgi:mono/diheme cytochrome c family protein
MFPMNRLILTLVPTMLLVAGVAFAQSDTAVGTASPSASTSAGNATHGKKLFLTVGCAECHGTVGQGGVGPNLSAHPLPAAVIAAYIRDPGGVMPPYVASVLSDADVADIAAYLRSIPPSPKPNQIPELSSQ